MNIPGTSLRPIWRHGWIKMIGNTKVFLLKTPSKRVHIGKPGQRLYLKAEEGGESVSLEEFIESREQLFSIVVTERRPLFAMKSQGYEPNGNIQELRWKITNRAPKYYTCGYDPLNRVGGAGYGYFSNSNPGGGSASGGGITAIPSQEYSVLGISYDAVGNITDTGQLNEAGLRRHRPQMVQIRRVRRHGLRFGHRVPR